MRTVRRERRFGSSSRDQGWGKIESNPLPQPIRERAHQILRVALSINVRNPSQRKVKMALENQAYKMLNLTQQSSFGGRYF